MNSELIPPFFLRIAIMGESTTQFLVKSLQNSLKGLSYSIEYYEADFNQIEINVLNHDSDFYKFQADYVVLAPSLAKFTDHFYASNTDSRSSLFEIQANHWLKTIDKIQNILIKSEILLLNYPEAIDPSMGFSSFKDLSSLTLQIRKTNLELAQRLSVNKAVTIVDLPSIQLHLSSKLFFDDRLRYLTKAEFTLSAYDLIANKIFQRLKTLNGNFVKLICIDLDGTIWGGIVGDDGWENLEIGDLGLGIVYTEIQRFLLELKKRGFLLAVNSKNNLEIVMEVFDRNSNMILKSEDISVFMVNWESKDMNLREISRITEIGMGSILFLDDNPFERQLVRQMLPEVLVPELPEDPSDYLNFIANLDVFDSPISTLNDQIRTDQIHAKIKLNHLEKNFASVEDFLEAIHMTAKMTNVSNGNIARFVQLSLRSNQFNLRTIRYTETLVYEMSRDPNYELFCVELEDDVANHGIIAGVVLKKIDNTFYIENLFMSCRVLKRGVELFILNEVVDLARKHKLQYIVGEYIETPKNRLVENLYSELGFTPCTNRGSWSLDLIEFIPISHYIRKEN